MEMTPTRTLCAVVLLCAAVARPAAAAEPVEEDAWGHAFYFPASAAGGPGRVPLVVYLHGCNQPRWHALATTRLQAWAEARRFAVLLPEQSRLRNGWKCWNWFLGDDSLEMDEVVALVRSYQDRFPLLRRRTYVMGLSAGGVLAAHLLACRSDVFRAGAVHSGAAYRAVGLPEVAPGLDVLGASPRAERSLGRSAYRCLQATRRPRPVSVLVLHGSGDRVARPANGRQVALQFAWANARLVGGPLDAPPPPIPAERHPATAHQRAWSVTRWEADQARVEWVEIDGMGHAWSGGPAWIPFSDDEGPDATRLALDFFGISGGEPAR
ncbi:MAG: prolyl oligopeptidase family serine peptidase [Deltaproteobacteria bacterium]|nr:prolyl oligopeptidase family serine peptidase [Deltaproteobacteria bacterium]